MSLPNHASTGSPGEPPADGGAGNLVARAARTNLFLAASLVLPGQPGREVRVRNLSASGARVDLADPPPAGTTAILRRNSAKVAATIVWASPASCGLRFSEAIDTDAWISDRAIAAPARAAGEPTLADDLGLIRMLLERLEDGLAGQPAVIGAVGAELQALDLAAQLIRLAEQHASGAPAPGRRSVRQAAEILLQRASGLA